jgi:two-component system OmpR family sensor kinase
VAWWSTWSLRSRLLVAMVALVSLGLLVSDVATWAALRSFLLERVDRQLADQAERARGMAHRAGPPDEYEGIAGGPHPGGVVDVQLRDPGGRVLQPWAGLDGGQGNLTAAVDAAMFARLRDRPRVPMTVDGGTGRFRVWGEPLPNGSVLLLGTPLGEVDRTLGRLLLIELLVTLVVVGTLGLVAQRLVRVGLRPLDQMTMTAAAIAAGDLTRRVPAAGEHTEVGRLGRALNTMLARIEAAFAARRASEDQLRRFVGDASHELRTPLTSIRGYAELFRRGASERPEDLALAMRRIEDEAARMGELVDELLLLARLDQGRPLVIGPVDLREVAVDAAFDAKAVEPDRQVEVEVDGPVVVLGDEARLRQIAANLLANVRMHTSPAAAVTVRLAARDGVGVLEVADTGPGLEPEQAGRVFERFYRTDPSRSRERGGAGLGLSIVAALAQAHGGRASVSSVPGEGATFRVELPLAPPETAREAGEPQAGPQAGPQPADRHG